MPFRCEDTWQWLHACKDLQLFTNMKAAQLHSSGRAANLAPSTHCFLCERVIDGGMVWWIDRETQRGRMPALARVAQRRQETLARSGWRREIPGWRHVANTRVTPPASLHHLISQESPKDELRQKDGFELVHPVPGCHRASLLSLDGVY